jgi:protein-tyrosine phosphatase
VAKKHGPPPADHNRAYKIVPGLFISGHPEHARDFMTRGVDAVVDLEGDIDEVVTEAESEKHVIYLYWPISDEHIMPDPHGVRRVSALVAGLIDDGKEVLVHCRSGHNRSGMVCARALITQGLDPQEAIDKVREGRGDGEALTNPTFVRWLLDEAPS